MNIEIQRMLLREEISIINALMAVGYWPSKIRFDSRGRFSVGGALCRADHPDAMRLLKVKELYRLQYKHGLSNHPRRPGVHGSPTKFCGSRAVLWNDSPRHRG
jgi:hypothetical protein